MKLTKKEKKKYCNESIMQIEQGSFTPLGISVTSGMSRGCPKFYFGLSEMISGKRDVNYSTIATWIRRKINFH